MNNYLSEIDRILRCSGRPYDSMAIINADGIIEYMKRYATSSSVDLTPFHKNVIGRHLLDAYPDITEDTSTVLETLRTGKITKLEEQHLAAGDLEITISATTYPIFDHKGNIQGAIDAVQVLDYRDNAVIDCDEGLSILSTIITKNMQMSKIKSFVADVAKNDSPVFIYGETGTGKELIAQALHWLSPRKDAPFISQNCAAIPDTLLESTFFGTEKGGFTGAETKPGLFEMADGGTLFLDEIHSMDTSMQAKLLKILEEQSARRVGGERSIPFDVRIVCASNEKAADLLRQQKLRADFYYRISVVKVDLPPLKERPEDILPLTKYFIKHYNNKMHKEIKGLSRMTEDVFLKWHWPGNIRELKGVIECAFNVETSNVITLDAITDLLSRMEESDDAQLQTFHTDGEDCFSLAAIREHLDKGSIDLKSLLEDYERAIIKEALRHDRKLNTVADQLTMSPQKLNYRISKLKLK